MPVCVTTAGSFVLSELCFAKCSSINQQGLGCHSVERELALQVRGSGLDLGTSEKGRKSVQGQSGVSAGRLTSLPSAPSLKPVVEGENSTELSSDLPHGFGACVPALPHST